MYIHIYIYIYIYVYIIEARACCKDIHAIGAHVPYRIDHVRHHCMHDLIVWGTNKHASIAMPP